MTLRRPPAILPVTLSVSLLVVLSLLALGCKRQTAAKAKSPAPAAAKEPVVGPFPDAPVFLISVDTLRSDHLPVYGYHKVETPAISALAQSGIVFEHAYSQVPLTFPSHTSILTGQLPIHHGIRDNQGYSLDVTAHPFLPLLLHAHGYTTGGAVSAYVLRAATGLAKGFDFYDSNLKPREGESLGTVQRKGTETEKVALDWIDKHYQKPLFFFLHLYEPHAPYDPPEPFASRFASPYDGEIATADAIIGDFFKHLKQLGLYDRSIIIFLSDHGEGLGEHGEQEHGMFLYRDTLQVPLILKLPGGDLGGTRVAAPAELVDVFPTVCQLLGMKDPSGIDGHSLFTLMAPSPPQHLLYAETYYPQIHYGWSHLTSMIRGHYQLIFGPMPQLFDLATDPGELHDVSHQDRKVAVQLHQALEKFQENWAPPKPANAETAHKLEALGYLGGVAQTSGPLPDPRTKLKVIADVDKAFADLNEQKYGEALPLLEKLVKEDPQMVDVWSFLAAAQHRLGRDKEALATYRKALTMTHGSPQLLLATATLLYQMGRLDEAERHAELSLSSDPQGAYDLMVRIALKRGDEAQAMKLMRAAVDKGVATELVRQQLAKRLDEAGHPEQAIALLRPVEEDGAPPTLNTLAMALSDAGKNEEAMKLLGRSLAQDERMAQTQEYLGIVSLRLDKADEARGYLERAVKLDPKLANAWNTLGVALFRTGGAEPALAAWQRAVRLDPTLYDALFNMGLVAASTGHMDQARKALRQFVATAPKDQFGPDIAKAKEALTHLGG